MKKAKYIHKQPHRNTCGVVAIVNILRSFGVKATYTGIMEECGGLKKVNKQGITIQKIQKVLKKHNVHTVGVHASPADVKKYATHKNARVALAYAWFVQKGMNFAGGPHVVMLRRNGSGINTGPYGRITEDKWLLTYAHWGMPPVAIVCVQGEGGAR